MGTDVTGSSQRLPGFSRGSARNRNSRSQLFRGHFVLQTCHPTALVRHAILRTSVGLEGRQKKTPGAGKQDTSAREKGPEGAEKAPPPQRKRPKGSL